MSGSLGYMILCVLPIFDPLSREPRNLLADLLLSYFICSGISHKLAGQVLHKTSRKRRAAATSAKSAKLANPKDPAVPLDSFEPPPPFSKKAMQWGKKMAGTNEFAFLSL